MIHPLIRLGAPDRARTLVSHERSELRRQFRGGKDGPGEFFHEQFCGKEGIAFIVEEIDFFFVGLGDQDKNGPGRKRGGSWQDAGHGR